MSVDSITPKISPETAKTLHGLFMERVRRTPYHCAYRHWDPSSKSWHDTTWREAANEVSRWQAAMRREGFLVGDRVAIMAKNRLEWVFFDQAALSLGLVVVPLYLNDRPENVAYCLEDSGARLLVIDGDVQWRGLRSSIPALVSLTKILCFQTVRDSGDPRVQEVGTWLAVSEVSAPQESLTVDLNSLATIVYTSGTTGRPKGVQLTHQNLLWNAYQGLQLISVGSNDLFLSFLPLSHALERMAGYYLAIMTGATVAFARSILQLSEDLQTVRPTVLICVPRVLEKIHARIEESIAVPTENASFSARLVHRVFRLALSIGWKQFLWDQGRQPWHVSLLISKPLDLLVARKIRNRLGGRLRLVVSGGAALSGKVAQFFIALGVPVCQGYGLTEHSPVISVNPLENNDPFSVGIPLPGVECQINEQNELWIRSPSVTQGYWKNPTATEAIVDTEGWLRTGDQACFSGKHLKIIGRIKEILVLSNGEKVPPVDMEMAIESDPLFEQVLVAGEGKSFLSAILVLNDAQWTTFCQSKNFDSKDPAVLSEKTLQKAVLARIRTKTQSFPGYAQIRGVHLTKELWTVENALLTPTLKPRRAQILARYGSELEILYQGLE